MNERNVTKTEQPRVAKKEIAGHAIAGVGQNLIFGLWSNFMLVFFTDVAGITGAVAGLIMMFTRVWDAVNDPMMGVIADRTRTRWGRYRPWLLFMALPVLIVFTLNFTAFPLAGSGKIVYAAVLYVMMSMVFTAVDVPYWTLPAAMSQDVGVRTTIYTVSRTTTTLASLVVGVVAIPIVLATGGGNMGRGYFFTALLLGAAGAALYLCGFSLVREHVTPPAQEKFSFKEAASVIVQNKPLLLILISMVIAAGAMFVRMNLIVYYVQYNLGRLDLVAAFNLISLPAMLVGMLLVPFLSKKMGQKGAFIGCCAFAAVTNLIFFFIGYKNLTAVMVMYFITSFPNGVVLVMLSAMIVNTIEYAEWKTGQRREGIISSTQTFLAKVGMAIGGGLSGLILTVSRYVPNQTQAASTLTLFHISITLIVALAFGLGIIPMLFNELTDERHREIMEELLVRKKARELGA